MIHCRTIISSLIKRTFIPESKYLDYTSYPHVFKERSQTCIIQLLFFSKIQGQDFSLLKLLSLGIGLKPQISSRYRKATTQLKYDEDPKITPRTLKLVNSLIKGKCQPF